MTVVYNQVSFRGWPQLPHPRIRISKAKFPAPPWNVPIHNVDTCVNLQHPPAHICQCFDPNHNPYHLVCAWNAHHEPNGRELRVHSFRFEIPRESTRPKAKYCRYSTTLLRRVCNSSTRIHSSRPRTSNARDVPLQIWILYVSSLRIPYQNLSWSIYDSIPTILDIWCLYSHVAFAWTTYQHNWLGSCMDARENGRWAQGNHRHSARSWAQMGETMPMCHSHSYSSCSIRWSYCLGSPPPLIWTCPHTHGLHSFITTFVIHLHRFFRITITGLHNQQNFAFTFTLRTQYSLRFASCSPFDSERNVSIIKLFFIRGTKRFLHPCVCLKRYKWMDNNLNDLSNARRPVFAKGFSASQINFRACYLQVHSCSADGFF